MLGKGIVYFLKNIGVSIALAAVVAVATALLLAMIFLGLFQSVIALAVVCAILGGVIGTGAGFFTYGEGSGMNPKRGYGEDDFYEKRAKNGKPVKFKHVFWALFPMLVLGISLVVIAVFVVYNLEITINYDSFGLEETALLPAMLPAVAAYNLIGFFVCVNTAKSYACPKCGTIMNWTKIKEVSYDTGERIKTKRTDTYGKIGEVYYKDEKIGDIKGDTGYTTTTTVVAWSSSSALYQCNTCGHQLEFGKYDERVKDQYRDHTSYYK